jgi:ABC-type transport system involved in cytochrome bd biosynthesis fused ATPase/permease subunit
MECGLVEDRLSEYVERTLPHEEMVRVAEHIQECARCQGLMEEIRSILVTCHAFPSYEADVELIDRVLLKTSGRPRSRSLRERFRAYFLQPILTPRFAMGVGLALLSVALLVDLMAPRVGTLASTLTSGELLSRMDRGVQQIYSAGLKLYDTKNEYQTQLAFFKNNLMHKLGFMIEQLDVPAEGNKKPDEQKQPEKTPAQPKKSSVLLLPA